MSNTNITHEVPKNIVSGLSGLVNIGNTCYMNSVLQCLRHTNTLNEHLWDPKIKSMLNSNIDEKTITDDNVATILSYIKLINVLWENKNIAFVPIEFKKMFSQLNPQFNGNYQHDSHEFLVSILDAFHDILKRPVSYRFSGMVQNEMDNHIKKAHDDWILYYNLKYSPILDVFSGQLITTTSCNECKTHSYKYDPFMILDVPIPKESEAKYGSGSDQRINIYNCFDNFVNKELLTGTNTYQCDVCVTKTNAEKHQLIWKLPNVLIIKINRFEYVNGTSQKIPTNIDYPITEELDMTKYVKYTEVNKSVKYKLFSIICHEGTHNNGHYYSICYNTSINEWCLYNDQSFRIVTNLCDVSTHHTYILFYERV
jgi:ubiquitin carboxyl-terminal hydrolase 2/21